MAATGGGGAAERRRAHEGLALGRRPGVGRFVQDLSGSETPCWSPAGAGTSAASSSGCAGDAGWNVRATWWRREPIGSAEWVHADVRDAEAMRRAVARRRRRHPHRVRAGRRRMGGERRRARRPSRPRPAGGASSTSRATSSSTGARGRYREDDAPAPVNSYGRSKAEAERLVTDDPRRRSRSPAPRSSTAARSPGRRSGSPATGTRFFVDEIRSPVQVGDLARALLEVLELGCPRRAPSRRRRRRLALRLRRAARRRPGADRAGETTPDRAPDVSLDSSRAAGLLETRLRGAREVLG